MAMGKFQGKKQGSADQSKDKGSFTEQGGQVWINDTKFHITDLSDTFSFDVACYTSNRTYSYCRRSTSRKPFYQSIRKCIQSRIQV